MCVYTHVHTYLYSEEQGVLLDDSIDDSVRSIRYHFGPAFLDLAAKFGTL